MQSKDIRVGEAYLVKYGYDSDPVKAVVLDPPAHRAGAFGAAGGVKISVMVDGIKSIQSLKPQAFLRVYTAADHLAKEANIARQNRADKVADLLAALFGIDVYSSHSNRAATSARIAFPRSLDLEDAEALLKRFGMEVPK